MKKFFFSLHYSYRQHTASTKYFHLIWFAAVNFSSSQIILHRLRTWSIGRLLVLLGWPRIVISLELILWCASFINFDSKLASLLAIWIVSFYESLVISVNIFSFDIIQESLCFRFQRLLFSFPWHIVYEASCFNQTYLLEFLFYFSFLAKQKLCGFIMCFLFFHKNN